MRLMLLVCAQTRQTGNHLLLEAAFIIAAAYLEQTCNKSKRMHVFRTKTINH